MKPNHLAIVALAAFSAVTLRAQTPADQSAPPPPPPPPESAPAPYAYSYGQGYGSDIGLAGAITLPYAFAWDATGVSAEFGRLWMQNNFFGGEISYYGGDRKHYDVFNSSGAFLGHFDSSQNVTTLDFAYRYFAPLWAVGPQEPVSFYIGGSAGVGFVNYSNDGSAFGFYNKNNGDFTGEFLAGLQFSSSRNVAFRLGYRYITVNDAWRFNQNVNLDSSVLEAGVAFRF
jgi:opacity protein-like surface antigen